MKVKLPSTVLIFFLFLFLAKQTASQTGTWKTFTNMNTIRDILVETDNLWCATTGGVLKINLLSQNIEKITNVDGLGGNFVNTLTLDSQGTFWFGSNNGKLSQFDSLNFKWQTNADFVNQNNRKMRLKKILPDGNKLWIATDLGLCLFLVDRNEIREIYRNFGTLPSGVEVNTVILKNDTLWIGTSQGVALASKNDPNLLDPSHWLSFKQNEGGLGNDSILSLLNWNSSVLAGTERGIYRLASPDSNWQAWDTVGIKIRALKMKADTIYAATDNGIYYYLNGTRTQFSTSGLTTLNLNSLDWDGTGKLWVGTEGKGLAFWDNLDWQSLEIPGPPKNLFRSLALDRYSRLWSSHGIFGASRFDGLYWKIYSISGDFTEVLVDQNQNTWFATWGQGVYKIDSQENISQFNNLNSPLKGVTANPNYVVVFKMAADESGNIWFGNREAWDSTRLVIYKSDGNFASQIYTGIPGDGFRSSLITEVFSKGSKVWVGYRDVGMDELDFNYTIENKADDILTYYPQSNFFDAGHVPAITVDKNEIVWVGTSNGLFKFDPDFLDFDSVPLPPPLGPQVNALIVNQRNHLWVGTSNGVGVLDGQGNWQIFTSDNSFLVDNYIYDIEINSQTGEVWIGTENGLSKFNSPVLEAAQNLSTIKVYPNPVIINSGNEKITFQKLPYGAKVRIFTVAGDLVKDINTSEVWDLRNENGKLVASGVYLFLVKDTDGKTYTGKIAVIRP